MDENTSHCFGKHKADMMVQQHLKDWQVFLYQASACPSRFLPEQFWFHHEHTNSTEASAGDLYKEAAKSGISVHLQKYCTGKMRRGLSK